jgi:hypothetical protein
MMERGGSMMISPSSHRRADEDAALSLPIQRKDFFGA